MNLELGGQVIVVTGGSAGIGQATVRLLSAEGAWAIGVARQAGPAPAVAADLTDPGAAERVVSEVMERFGRLDGLVNNAAALESRDGFLGVDDAQWHATLELNLHAAVRMTRAALPALSSSGGSIVHVASEAARFPESSLVDYSASKAALLSVSKALAAEFGGSGVRSNVVSPGPTRRACGTHREASPSSSPSGSAFRPSRRSTASCARYGACRAGDWVRPTTWLA